MITDNGRTGRKTPWRSVVVGLTAGAVLLAVAEITSLAFSASSSPLVAVGGAFIDLIPPWVKDLAISLFGTRDKDILLATLLMIAAALSATIGWFGARRPRIAGFALASLGLLASAIVLTRSGTKLIDAIPTLVGTIVAVPTLLLLLHVVRLRETTVSTTVNAAASRRTMIGVTTLGVVAVIAGFGARTINVSREFASRAARFILPKPETPAAPIPPAAQVGVQGMPKFLTPSDDFYRIDTALLAPRVDPTEWQLRIYGLVDREVTLNFEDLLAEPMIEKHVTLACVSNPVGGDLVGNATWLGVPVRTLLERAGVQDEADMALSRSIDGFTASTPLEALTDERDSLVAVGMNGDPLPRVHGYPVRLVVPGLYGYVSATKWVTELKVTRFVDDVAYWSTRGWSDHGPIKTASRIDVPRSFATVTRDAEGVIMIGGTAWAQQRGIAKVEVRIDNGKWRDAMLGDSVNDDTWRQWSLRWDPAPAGKHQITVRATDGEGAQQTETRAAPAPNGASGWHSVEITVT